MKEHDMTEYAYKNGFAAGQADALNQVITIIGKRVKKHQKEPKDDYYWGVDFGLKFGLEVAKKLAERLIETERREKADENSDTK